MVDTGNPTLATKDAATGKVLGVAVDMAQGLSDSLKTPFVLVEYHGLAGILRAVNANAWDVAFLGISGERAAVMDFSDASMQ